MCFYIGIEDLAANALIEVMDKSGRTCISYRELESYGAHVVQLLSQKGEKAVLLLSRADTNALFRNYSEFFEEIQLDGEPAIQLCQGKKVEDLIIQFRGYLALDLLLALVDESSVSVLGV
ncbi:MAG: hypothetical protein NC180_01030 [Muribaculaceae bacterium]|nr:hypothetical protein [Roseburia sp.]MCM1431355.1 hypothetical protein [Muribaculaceae bacterium]MCM1491797.1 hypothetical protein [Muribaculaceae bacterium]